MRAFLIQSLHQPRRSTKERNCISEYLGTFIFIFEGKLSYQLTDGRLDNIKIKQGVNPDDEARNLECPGKASTEISRSTKAQSLA